MQLVQSAPGRIKTAGARSQRNEMIILMQTVKPGEPALRIRPLNPSFAAKAPASKFPTYKHEDSLGIETSSRTYEAIENAQASSSKGATSVVSLKFVEGIGRPPQVALTLVPL
jgi:hypothetical protein